MKILFLEPFYTGSHRNFAEGVREHSSHDIDLQTLPGRFRKWRMRGAALEFARKAEKSKRYDLVVAGNLMDLAQWKMLAPEISAPHILYIHENQLAYPLKEGEKRDFQYGWTDFTNMLCADTIVFNSAFNRDSFFFELDSLMARLPDCRPSRDFTALMEKSRIVHPGCDLAPSWREAAKFEKTGKPPLIIWNHRWEHDKNPEDFFQALRDLKTKKIPFRIALLGESYETSPHCFRQAERFFKQELIHTGYIASKEEYRSWLEQADFVISTALQENFGMSVVEAVSYGVLPLLPDRLAYPEVLPGAFHKEFLYGDLKDLQEKFIRAIGRADLPAIRNRLSQSMQPYSWSSIIQRFDRLFEETLAQYGKK